MGIGRRLRLAPLAVALALPLAASAAELDPAVVTYRLPQDIQWRESPSGAASAVLHGNPAETGLYVMLVKWKPGHMSRPHSHPKDRFITVVSGTWWVGAGGAFDPERTVPMPAGSFVTHYANGVHFDGAKTEEAVLQIVGEGPATGSPFAPR
jgi:quercetin dioxygenase-like cupin family protein